MKTNVKELTGYKRKDGRFGIRNHLLVIPTVVCANVVVERLAKLFGDRIVAVSHPYGCSFDPVSNDELSETLVNFATNPNVGAVVLVSLGCETVDDKEIFKHIHRINPRSVTVTIQDIGGIQKAIDRLLPQIESFILELDSLKREPMTVADLIVGLQCGASDSYSGLTANPALGRFVDRLVQDGGTAILAELTEFLGAEDEAIARCVDDEKREMLRRYLDETEKNLARVGTAELHDIAPGNIAGGITTLEEKSLGCIKKGGSSPIVDVVAHGDKPKKKGLVVMETSGQDIESVVAITAGGAQVCFFTTGRGSPTGSPIIPIVKIASNTEMAERLSDLIDLDAGTILEDKETLDDVAGRLYQTMMDVVNGKQTKSEINGSREFAVRRRGVDVCIL